MFRIVTLITLVVTLFVTVAGAYVQLTNGWIGCSDWPGCYLQQVEHAAVVMVASLVLRL